MDDAREYTMRLCQILTNRIGLTEEECKYIAGVMSDESYEAWWQSLGYKEKCQLIPGFKQAATEAAIRRWINNE